MIKYKTFFLICYTVFTLKVIDVVVFLIAKILSESSFIQSFIYSLSHGYILVFFWPKTQQHIVKMQRTPATE